MWLFACARQHDVTGPWLRQVPSYLGELTCIYVPVYNLLIYVYKYIYICLYKFIYEIQGLHQSNTSYLFQLLSLLGRHVSTSSTSSSRPDLRIQVLYTLAHKMQVGISVAYNLGEVKLAKINHWICVQREDFQLRWDIKIQVKSRVSYRVCKTIEPSDCIQ